MAQPIIVPEGGHCFEKKAIVAYLRRHSECPLCHKETSVDRLVPNHHLKQVVNKYTRTKRQLEFAEE